MAQVHSLGNDLPSTVLTWLAAAFMVVGHLPLHDIDHGRAVAVLVKPDIPTRLHGEPADPELAPGKVDLVAKVEAKGPPVFLTDLPMLENRFQFARHLRNIGKVN